MIKTGEIFVFLERFYLENIVYSNTINAFKS
jgi:hypothetical protein